MGYLVRWLPPALAASLALCGCAALEQRPSPAATGAVSGTDPAGARAAPAAAVPAAAASAGASTQTARELRPADPRRNLDLLVYGVSYHTDRDDVRRRKVDNELNAGLGLEFEFHNDDRGAAFLEAGFYKDSGRKWAKLAGPGYQFKLGDRWRLGAILPVIQSPTYNSGRAFVAPIPLLTYDFGAVRLNAVYAPRIRQYQIPATFGFYLGIPFGK